MVQIRRLSLQSLCLYLGVLEPLLIIALLP